MSVRELRSESMAHYFHTFDIKIWVKIKINFHEHLTMMD